MIVSASRRCDLPRFQFDRFWTRLEAGFTEAVNPFNRRQVRRVSLLPEDMEALVFWTRDPRPVLARAAELEARSYRFYLMCTLTGYPGPLEPGVPPAEAVIPALRRLADIIGPRRVIWRYDPVLLTSLTGGDFHRRNFETLAGALRGAVRRVILSLYDPYPAAERRLAALKSMGTLAAAPPYGGEGPPPPDLRALLGDLAAMAGAAGMETQSCAEPALEVPGIRPGACIDGELIRELWGLGITEKDRNQRPHCRCAPSVDIGQYGPCPAGCVYCYARSVPG